MLSLKESCRTRFKMMFEGLNKQVSTMTFILVTDDFSLRILSSFLKMMELVNYGITAIEKLSLKRKKFHKIQTIYLLSENEDSLNRLLADFPSEDNAQYGSVHIFFTTHISDITMDRISSNAVLLSRIKTFKELNLEFICATQNEYLLDIFPNPQSFKRLYSGTGAMYKAEERSAIERLATLVVSFPKFYGIQILYSAPQVQNVAEKIAQGLSMRLHDMFGQYAKTRCQNYEPQAKKITLVILDRSYDPISPLVRDFHYLSMLSDLKEINDFKTTYSDGQSPPHVLQLDESDEIYTKYKYGHLAELMKGVSRDFQDFLNTNAAAKLEKGQAENLDATKLGDIMKKIPQYNDTKQKYCMHTKYIGDLFEIHKQRNLQAIGELEQTIITGVNPQGGMEKDPIIYNNLIGYLSREKSPEIKARLACLGLMCLNLGQKEKGQLQGMLASFGIQYRNLPRGVHFMTGGRVMPKLKQAHNPNNLILDRHTPRLEQVIGDIVTRGGKADLKSLKINTDDKGIINDKANVMVRKKLGRQEPVLDMPKIIVYIVGGIGFNEIRCANKFSGNFSIICGSNQIFNPNLYMKELNSLSSQQAQL